MSSVTSTEIHISEIDEYLAEKYLDSLGKPLGLLIEKSGDEGYIKLTQVNPGPITRERVIDFELSPSEYLTLDGHGLSELLASTIVTSSAHELFDFMLLRFKSFECLLEFTGIAWKMSFLDYAE